MEHVTATGIDYYLPVGAGRTRSMKMFTRISCGQNGRPQGVPCSVDHLDEDSVNFLCVGPGMADGPSEPDTFFEFLKSWGGEWMWTNIVNEGRDLRWVVEAITKGF